MSSYTIDWRKYDKVSLAKCYRLEDEFRRTFHTCPIIMDKKKELEKLVRKCSFNKDLKELFKTDYRNRKETFYQRIMTDNLLGQSTLELQIQDIVKDIIFIYSKKTEELEYLTWKVNDLDAQLEQEELHREYMIEQFRGCD